MVRDKSREAHLVGRRHERDVGLQRRAQIERLRLPGKVPEPNRQPVHPQGAASWAAGGFAFARQREAGSSQAGCRSSQRATVLMFWFL